MNGIALNGLVALPAGFALLAWLVSLPRNGAGTERDRMPEPESQRDRWPLAVAVAGGAATLLWSVWVALRDLSLAEGVDVVWIGAIDVHWHLGADGISVPLVLMTTLITLCCLVSLVRQPPRDPAGAPDQRVALAVLLLVIEAGVLGCFLALDMVLFFLFFEVALIPMWFVISRWGDAHDEAGRHRAANRFLVFTVLGSAIMLVGFTLVHGLTGTFDILEIAATYRPSGAVAVTAAVLVGLGLAVKTPLWPLHIWLPDAHSKAPTVGSVILAAVLLKLGTYGFVRFWIPVVDPAWELFVPLVAGLAVVGIIYAALACLVQTDLKRLIAYSSVGHMGFIVLAAATFTVGGVQAAVYASVAHGLITGLLFFCAGAIKDRYDSTDLGELTVLYGRVPRLAAVFAFAAMASLGLPGLAGFWGEMVSIRSALYPAEVLPQGTFVVLAVIAALGVILTTAYFLALLRRMLQGEPAAPEPDRTLVDVHPMEWVVWTPLIVPILVFGVAPGLLLTPVSVATRAFFGGL